MTPGIVNRTKSNWISIELNRTQSNPIHGLSSIDFRNRTKSNSHTKKLGNRTQSNLINWIVFDWVRWPNPIEHNPMDWVRLGSISHTKFDVRFRSIAELNRTQSIDWVRLSSIEFEFRTFDWVCRDDLRYKTLYWGILCIGKLVWNSPICIFIYFNFNASPTWWPCGPMDKASDYGSGDSRFESWQGRPLFSFLFQRDFFFSVSLSPFIRKLRVWFGNLSFIILAWDNYRSPKVKDHL